jgi:hypothetical protein
MRPRALGWDDSRFYVNCIKIDWFRDITRWINRVAALSDSLTYHYQLPHLICYV